MERFYIKEKYTTQTDIFLKETEHHHLSRVLRLREADEIELVNGLGSLAKAKIVKIEKHQTSVRILEVKQAPPLSEWVWMGLPLMRPSKLEWVIEKGTELGADAFFLYSADHSTQESLSDHQMERLRAITISALKQSKRLYLPSLEVLPHLESLLSKEALMLFGDVRPKGGSYKINPSPITCFITGPESGFSDREYILLDSKAKSVRLNANVLRAETAPIVALSILCQEKKGSS